MIVSVECLLNAEWGGGVLELPLAESRLSDVLIAADGEAGGRLGRLMYREGDERQLGSTVFVCVNGVNCRFLDGLATTVRDGDRVLIARIHVGG